MDKDLNISRILQYIHNFDNVVLIWWYNPKRKELKWFKDADGHGDKRFLPFLAIDSNYLEKGRVVKYQNKLVMVIYADNSGRTNLSDFELRNLIDKIENIVGKLDYVISQNGDNLLNEGRIDLIEELIKSYG